MGLTDLMYRILFYFGVYTLRGIAVSNGTERILSDEEIFEFNKVHATKAALSDYFNGYILSIYAQEYNEESQLVRWLGYAVFKQDNDTGYRLFPEHIALVTEQTDWHGFKREDGKLYGFSGPYYSGPKTISYVIYLLTMSKRHWYECDPEKSLIYYKEG